MSMNDLFRDVNRTEDCPSVRPKPVFRTFGRTSFCPENISHRSLSARMSETLFRTDGHTFLILINIIVTRIPSFCPKYFYFFFFVRSGPFDNSKNVYASVRNGDVRPKSSANKLMDWINWAQEIVDVKNYLILLSFIGFAIGPGKHEQMESRFNSKMPYQLDWWWVSMVTMTCTFVELVVFNLSASQFTSSNMNDVNTNTKTMVFFFKRMYSSGNGALAGWLVKPVCGIIIII